MEWIAFGTWVFVAAACLFAIVYCSIAGEPDPRWYIPYAIAFLVLATLMFEPWRIVS
jgi:hypothetical protein